MTTQAPAQDDASSSSDSASFHRTIFRLHFYAGIIVAPFLLILAITGAIYLFNTEIEDAVHPGWRLADQPGEHLPAARMVDSALAAYPGAQPTRIDLPTAPDRTAVVFLTPAAGEPFRVYVDPISGVVKGSFVYVQTLVGFSDITHGSLMMSDFGDGIVEIAACWAILLVATGLYLWWPRGPARVFGVFLPRLGQKGRPFWRDLHAVAGVWTSLLILFLLFTGLPWSTSWGTNLNKVMAAAGIGYPASYRTHVGHEAVPALKTGDVLGAANPGVPWTLEQAPAPMSHAGHDMAGMTGMAPIDVGTAAAVFAREGLTTAYRLTYPKDERDVFTAYTYPDQPEGQRTIHLDQYTGEVVNDVAFADYGVGAQAVELGVQIHMGNYFGVPNQLLMLVATLGAVMLAVTGPIMWLVRRKKGLGAPAPFRGRGVRWGFYIALIALGMLFPLMGLTLLVVLASERLILARIPLTRAWLGLS